MKLIGNPAKLATTNFRRLCDLRSREVCLYRAPVFRGIDRWLIRVGTRSTAEYAANLSESTLMGETMSTAILLCLTEYITGVKCVYEALWLVVSGTKAYRFQFRRRARFAVRGF